MPTGGLNGIRRVGVQTRHVIEKPPMKIESSLRITWTHTHPNKLVRLDKWSTKFCTKHALTWLQYCGKACCILNAQYNLHNLQSQEWTEWLPGKVLNWEPGMNGPMKARPLAKWNWWIYWTALDGEEDECVWTNIWNYEIVTNSSIACDGFASVCQHLMAHLPKELLALLLLLIDCLCPQRVGPGTGTKLGHCHHGSKPKQAWPWPGSHNMCPSNVHTSGSKRQKENSHQIACRMQIYESIQEKMRTIV